MKKGISENIHKSFFTLNEVKIYQSTIFSMQTPDFSQKSWSDYKSLSQVRFGICQFALLKI